MQAGGCGASLFQTATVLNVALQSHGEEEAPAAPTNLALTATQGVLNILATWDAVAGATSYRLIWTKTDWDNYPLPNLAIVDGTSHTITVSEYGDWDVLVRGCNDAGCGLGTWLTVNVPPPADTALEFPQASYAFIMVEGNRAVGTVAATDLDGDAITNYVKRGDDGADFELVKDANEVKTGELVFNLAPSFEYPHDDNKDNVYEFTIRAVSGTGDRQRSTATVNVTVTVVDAPESLPLTITTVVDGLAIPWDLDWTHDGTMLFTERGEKISVLRPNGTQRKLTADLSDVSSSQEGGLMGLVVDSDFATNRRFYTCQSVTVTKDDGSKPRKIHVVAWTLDDDYTTATRAAPDPLIKGIPAGTANLHQGCRLRIGPSGYLWISTGDANQGSAPQNLDSPAGNILRVDRTTGAAAPGNHHGLVYSYGHRNPQGLAVRPVTMEMWAVEHGPSQDDEINLLVNGGNYGGIPTAQAVIMPNTPP